jgi:hypothetical protein
MRITSLENALSRGPSGEDFSRLASLADVARVHAPGVVSDVSAVASAAIGLYDQVPMLIGDNFGDALMGGHLNQGTERTRRPAALEPSSHDLGERKQKAWVHGCN